MVSSNTCQPMSMFYRRNIVSQSHSVVFINTHCRAAQYKDANVRGNMVKDLLIETLWFDTCNVYENYSKEQIIRKLVKLQTKAEKHEFKNSMKNEGQKSSQSLAIAIIWIGFVLDPRRKDEKDLMDKQTFEKNPVGLDNSEYFKWLELTSLGEPICINEYATRIAQIGSSVHVIQLDDFQADMAQLLKPEHICYYVTFYEMVLTKREGRDRFTFCA